MQGKFGPMAAELGALTVMMGDDTSAEPKIVASTCAAKSRGRDNACEGVHGETRMYQPIFSASKLAAAATIMKLAEHCAAGKTIGGNACHAVLDIDKPVSTYLDWWSRDTAHDPRANVTLTHLLSMTAGLNGHRYR